MPNPIPPPFQNPIAIVLDPSKAKPGDVNGAIDPQWGRWLVNQQTQITTAPQLTGQAVQISSQSASITSTNLAVILNQGFYTLTYYIRVSTPASVSSSLLFSFSYSDHGVSLTHNGATLTGNLTSTIDAAVIPFYSDASSPVTYTVTYSSTGTAMQYQLNTTLKTEAI